TTRECGKSDRQSDRPNELEVMLWQRSPLAVSYRQRRRPCSLYRSISRLEDRRTAAACDRVSQESSVWQSARNGGHIIRCGSGKAAAPGGLTESPSRLVHPVKV